MKDRIKKLRKSLDMTQQEFAERIGVKRNTIGQYEIGRNEPIDTVINLICREFNVREEWLRTGEGEMFNPKLSDALDQLARENHFSNADYALVEKIISLKPQERNELFGKVLDFLHEVEAALPDADPFAPAFAKQKRKHPDSTLDIDAEVQRYREELELEARQAEKSSVCEPEEEKKHA